MPETRGESVLHNFLKHVPRVFLPRRTRTENLIRVISPTITGHDLDQFFRNCGAGEREVKLLFDEVDRRFGDRIDAVVQSGSDAETVALWNKVFTFVAERVAVVAEREDELSKSESQRLFGLLKLSPSRRPPSEDLGNSFELLSECEDEHR